MVATLNTNNETETILISTSPSCRPLCGRFCQAHRSDSTSELPIEGEGIWRLLLASGLMPSSDPLSVPALVGADHRILCSPAGDCEVSWRRPIQRSVRNEPGGITGTPHQPSRFLSLQAPFLLALSL